MDSEDDELNREGATRSETNPQEDARTAAADSATSEKKIAANRRNARRSTGPRTGEGKLRSRRNALKHGLSASEIVVPGFEDPSEYERMHDALVTDLAPVGAAEELLVRQIATCFLQFDRIARMEAAQAYVAQRAAILAPYVGAPSSSELAHERLRNREQDVAQHESELAYVEGLVAGWGDATRLSKEVSDRLAEFSIAEVFAGLEAASGEQQLNKLLYAADRLRVILSALDGADVPVAIRAHNALAPTDPTRYQYETHRRLSQLLRQLDAMQERRLARQATNKRPPLSATVIDIEAAEEPA